MKKTIFLFALACFMIFESCSTVRSSFDYDKTANFSSYKTYTIYKKGLDDLKINDLNKRRITENISTQMNMKGFTYLDSDQADLIINIRASSKEQTQVNSASGWGMSYPFWNPWGGWGVNMSNTWINKYQEGTLTFDIVDYKKNTLIWQGVSSGIMVDDIANADNQIQEAVQKGLANFPPPIKK